MPRKLSTAEDRTVAVVDAALHTFARAGYHATAVGEIAAAAGISQAYVFRLFPTKRALFVAALHECFDRIIAALRAAAETTATDASSGDVLDAMSRRYAELITDRDLIMLQIHAVAASDDDELRGALCADYARLVDLVTDRSGAPDAEVQSFFARGQLCHLGTALGLFDLDAHWAAVLGLGLYEPGRRTPARRRRKA